MINNHKNDFRKRSNRHTNTELRGSERANAWACRRHAHCVLPEFRPESVRESAKKESEFGALARTCFPPRSRFEIRSNFDIVFALNTKRTYIPPSNATPNVI